MTHPRHSGPARRDEILDVARRLFMTRGYEHTSIQSIIAEVRIAKGTFYHHFQSKEGLLEALVDRLQVEGTALLAPVLDDPSLDAPSRLRTVFTRVGAWKTLQRDLFADLGRTLYAPANAALLARLTAATLDAMDPVLARILEEGAAQGAFQVTDAPNTARIVTRIGVSLAEVFGQRLLAGDRGPGVVADLCATCRAHHEAIERVLGARPGSLCLIDDAVLNPWFDPEAP
ncbi:MAG: TetR/AcrR family transcriptional regulator [Deltaproteobacteria bacterium]|nr:TetR/AcrR family transcriptional regulator [Deltaproteobacteria bacterium]